MCCLAPESACYVPGTTEMTLHATPGSPSKKPRFGARVWRRMLGGLMHAAIGAVVAVLASFLVALLFAFRFPIPLGGMLGPFGSANPYTGHFVDVLRAVTFAWLLYGWFGGFVLVSLCGACAGFWAGRAHAEKHKNRMIVMCAAISGAVPVLWLCTLDYFIGPW